MNTHIFEKAMEIISQRRQKSKHLLSLKQSEIYSKIPEIYELKKELANTNIKLSKAILSKSTNKNLIIQNIKSDNLQMQNMVKELLVSNNYSESYLDVKYYCNLCQDTGFFNGKKCECLKQLIKELRAKSLNELSPLKVNTFRTFDLNYYENEYKEKMKKILNYCIKYSQTFSYNSPSVLMMGKTGLGKTHLSLAIANDVISKGFSIIYGSTQDLFRSIEKEHFGKESNSEYTLDALIQSDLLILDDLGAEFESNFYTSVLYNIINSRINKTIPTIISTNLDKHELEYTYNAKITSRLFNFNVLGFVGKDIRQIKNAPNINNI